METVYQIAIVCQLNRRYDDGLITCWLYKDDVRYPIRDRK